MVTSCAALVFGSLGRVELVGVDGVLVDEKW
jgi:hypothetical protein